MNEPSSESTNYGYGCRRYHSRVDPAQESTGSISNPFHVLQEQLCASAVVKLCRSTVGMAGDSLRHLQVTAILEKIRDPGRAEGMV
jgi:hypothetical protein